MDHPSRKFEQPENHVAQNAEEERARVMILEDRGKFIRGELTEYEVKALKEMLPAQIFQQWVYKKQFARNSVVQQKIILLKMRKQMKNILCGSRNRSEGTRRFRPGKEKSTLKKFMKKIDKLKKRFLKTGGGECAWYDLTRGVEQEFACSSKR